ncbi:protein lifeguard 1 isoform X2 [Thalassophryne amazonica]|uniref:protein lifeguard 1 isoform X2 n=1 Tax=Thalassophryne amazonica TaxID=390379 RepID=UPI0014713816|nr:protein lifeguard 1 isoform X2 [Thalassophryne amazonica]
MEQNNDSSPGGFGPHPPPYNQQDYVQTPYTGMSYKVGKGNITVVSPPGSYDTTAYPQYYTAAHGEGPPDYSQGSDDDNNCFSDAAVRRGFIRKVYLTLMIQLLVTVGIICAFVYWNTLKQWTRTTYWFSTAMMVVVLVLIVALSCCDSLRRQVPLNFIALSLFTIAEGLMLGSVTVYFDAEAVLWAVGATALVSFAMSLFAMQSKFLHIVYACLGTLVFSLYLVFDTQLILGGKHRKYSVSPEEYVFAALNLYLDIVTLFLLLLQLIGLCR